MNKNFSHSYRPINLDSLPQERSLENIDMHIMWKGF
jgi:hypothetical protein